MPRPDAPDDSGVITDVIEDPSASADVPDDSGVITDKATATGKDNTDPAVKLEFKKLRDRANVAEESLATANERNRALEEAARAKAPVEQHDEPIAKTGAPDYDDFDDPAEYHKAAARYAKDQVDKEDAEKAGIAKEAAAKEEANVKYNTGLAGAREKYKDFSEVSNVAGLYSSDALVDQMLACENAHDIVYHLGQNPAEAKRISGLSALQQARELGKLEAKFAGEPASNTSTDEPNQTTITNAAEPAADLPGGGTDTDHGGLTAAEYSAKRVAERAANRAGNTDKKDDPRAARRATARAT